MRPRAVPRRIRVVAAACCAFVSFCQAVRPLSAQEEEPLEENWYALYLNEQKAGYQHEQITERQMDGRLVYQSTVHQEFSLARAEAELRFVVDTILREDADGGLVAFRQRMEGPMSMTVQGKVEGDELLLRTGTGRSAKNERLPRPEGLCYYALRRMQRAKGYEPGTTYSVPAFVPEAPDRRAIVSVTVVGVEAVQVYEVEKRLNRVDSVIDILPGVRSTEWVDDAGAVWLVRAQLPGNLVLDVRKSTRDLALAPDDPADILAASIVPVDRPIPSPRRLERLSMLLERVEGTDTAPSIPSDAYQDVEKNEEGFRVVIRRAHGSPEASYVLPYAGEEYAAQTEPNVWMETGDPLVVQMTKEALDGETDALRAAGRIEAYVRDAIGQKNLSLGFATAAEAAAQKTGDCTEHAVLAAAMARAAGMPSRVVGGLAYVENLMGLEGGFGYHMWAEVYVGQWLPVDAALGGHDATHLALVRSDLNASGDLFEVSAAISQVFGGVRVRVLETEP